MFQNGQQFSKLREQVAKEEDEKAHKKAERRVTSLQINVYDLCLHKTFSKHLPRELKLKIIRYLEEPRSHPLALPAALNATRLQAIAAGGKAKFFHHTSKKLLEIAEQAARQGKLEVSINFQQHLCAGANAEFLAPLGPDGRTKVPTFDDFFRVFPNFYNDLKHRGFVLREHANLQGRTHDELVLVLDPDKNTRPDLNLTADNMAENARARAPAGFRDLNHEAILQRLRENENRINRIRDLFVPIIPNPHAPLAPLGDGDLIRPAQDNLDGEGGVTPPFDRDGEADMTPPFGGDGEAMTPDGPLLQEGDLIYPGDGGAGAGTPPHALGALTPR
ncbi:unnamed protein product [Amoebophrya sp. A120]|nr:unnamed protein product [Amoebophrya sp. A120]|eukprot:GSA120T00022932001.1